MPGHYPDRVCQHIHYLVTAPGCKPLITQLYFASDPVFEGDPDRNFTRDPLIHSRELVLPVILTGDPKEIKATVKFELLRTGLKRATALSATGILLAGLALAGQKPARLQTLELLPNAAIRFGAVSPNGEFIAGA